TLPLHADNEVARLHALFDRVWETRVQENPLFATGVNRHEHDDLLPSATPADLERRYQQNKASLAELTSIDRTKLPPDEKVNYDIFRSQLENGIASYELGDDQIPFK